MDKFFVFKFAYTLFFLKKVSLEQYERRQHNERKLQKFR